MENLVLFLDSFIWELQSEVSSMQQEVWDLPGYNSWKLYLRAAVLWW